MIENILWELEPKKAGAGEKTGAGHKQTGSATLTVGMFFFERIKKVLKCSVADWTLYCQSVKNIWDNAYP